MSNRNAIAVMINDHSGTQTALVPCVHGTAQSVNNTTDPGSYLCPRLEGGGIPSSGMEEKARTNLQRPLSRDLMT